MIVKEATLRDVIATARFIDNANLKQFILDGLEVQKAKSEADIEYTGINVMFDVIAGITDEKAEKELYGLIQNMSDIEDAGSMNLKTMKEFAKEFVRVNDLVNFFDDVKSVLKSLNLNS